MTEHSPTPWELIEANENHGAYVVNAYGADVCDLYAMSNPTAASVRNGGNSFPVHFTDAAANAALIVKAVNNHDALLKALDWAMVRICSKAPHHATEGDAELYAFAEAHSLLRGLKPAKVQS